MILDVRTAFVMGVGFIAVTAVTLFLLSRTLPPELRRSARTASAATALLAVTWSLFAFEDRLPDLATILLGNLLYLAAGTLVYQSVRLFDGLPPRHGLLLRFTAPVMLVILFFRYAVDIYSLRVVIMSASLALALALAARRLLVPASTALEDKARRVAAFWFLANAGIFAARVIVTVVQGGAPPVLANGPLPTLALATGLATVLGAIFGYFLLYSARVTSELERQAHLDPLTDLLNRRAFETLAAAELERASRDGGPVSVLLIDADRFKAINDTWGHEAGDEALQAIASALRTNLRPYDLLARLGGDEFAVLLPGLDERATTELVGRLKNAVSDEPFSHPGALHVSIGQTTHMGGGADVRDLLSQADADLYEQKGARERVAG